MWRTENDYLEWSKQWLEKVFQKLRIGGSFYLFGYGFFRFFIEYFRQPDNNIGYVIALGKQSDNIAIFQSFLNISKGQIFCLLMMAFAIIVFFIVNRRKENVKHR